jgi:hypothetical protein
MTKGHMVIVVDRKGINNVETIEPSEAGDMAGTSDVRIGRVMMDCATSRGQKSQRVVDSEAWRRLSRSSPEV